MRQDVRRLILLLLAVTIVVLPNVRAAPPPDDALAAEGAPQGDTEKPLTGRIFAYATFSTMIPKPNDPTSMCCWSFSGILTIDPNTGKWSYLGGGFGPRVSPDGNAIAYVKRAERPGESPEKKGSGCEIWIYDVEAKRKTLLVEFRRGTEPGCLCWSPDGKQLIFSAPGKDAKTAGTWLVSRDGTRPVKLPIPLSDQVEDWSPDGRWLLIVSRRETDRFTQVYRVRPDHSERVRLTEGAQNVHPRFSPDSRRVLYLSVDLSPARSGYSLRVVEADGSNDREILGDEEMTGVHTGCWSPDGKWLAVKRFDYHKSGDGDKIFGGALSQWRIEIMDAEGNNRRVLKPADGKIHVVGTDDQAESWFRLVDGEVRNSAEAKLEGIITHPDWR